MSRRQGLEMSEVDELNEGNNIRAPRIEVEEF